MQFPPLTGRGMQDIRSMVQLKGSTVQDECHSPLRNDTLWGSETQDDQHKEWLGPYFEFCTHLFKDLVEKDAPGYSSAFRKEEIQSVLRQLRSHPTTTKEDLRTFIRGPPRRQSFHQCTD